MESLLIWMILLAVPSAVGGASYLACRKANGPSEALIYLVTVGAGFLLIVMVVAMLIFPPSASLILLTYLCCILGGWAHTKTVAFVPHEWGSGRFLVYTSTLLSIFVGVLVAVPTSAFVNAYLSVIYQFLYWVLYLLSLLTGPAVMPFLIWMRQSTVLLPGVDKHFEE